MRGGEDWAAFMEANMEVSASMKMRLMNNDFEALIARFAAMYEKRSLPHYLDPIQMPCLIYVGEEESAYGGARQLADRLPDAKFVAFPGLNHYNMLTSIEVVLPEILRFLSKAG